MLRELFFFLFILWLYAWHSCDTQVMRIIEALEGKGSRLPLMKGEAELAEKLAGITRQVIFVISLLLPPLQCDDTRY